MLNSFALLARAWGITFVCVMLWSLTFTVLTISDREIICLNGYSLNSWMLFLQEFAEGLIKTTRSLSGLEWLPCIDVHWILMIFIYINKIYYNLKSNLNIGFFFFFYQSVGINKLTFWSNLSFSTCIFYLLIYFEGFYARCFFFWRNFCDVRHLL